MHLKKIILSFIFSISSITVHAETELVTLAGGCFWCTESDMESYLKDTNVISGYSGGQKANPTYREVSSGKTKHIESIQFSFDNSKFNYKDILDYFIRHIDPTDSEGSFYDRGYQYSPAIFYHTNDQKLIAESFIKDVNNSNIYPKPLKIKILPYENFYEAENYHQDYYKKNSVKYKFYRYRSGRDKYIENILGENTKTLQELINRNNVKIYEKPDDKTIKSMLTKLQYEVTQNDKTEKPFKNKYWNNTNEGIYVDIVSGEPLFSSTDKYKSGTGWPSFTKPIDEKYIVEKDDFKLFTKRIEIRSRFADSHLGHVFEDGPEPTGLRYCMNSASMNFIPKNKMIEKGYEDYLYLFEN